jgi:hypothetical protein
MKIISTMVTFGYLFYCRDLMEKKERVKNLNAAIQNLINGVK